MPLAFYASKKDNYLHVFLLGISDYKFEYQQLRPLKSPCISVYSLYKNWIFQRKELKIASITMLISPSTEEKDKNKKLEIIFNKWLKRSNSTIEANYENFKREIIL